MGSWLERKGTKSSSAAADVDAMGAVASACLHLDLNDSMIFVWAGRGAMALAEAPRGNQQGAQ